MLVLLSEENLPSIRHSYRCAVLQREALLLGGTDVTRNSPDVYKRQVLGISDRVEVHLEGGINLFHRPRLLERIIEVHRIDRGHYRLSTRLGVSNPNDQSLAQCPGSAGDRIQPGGQCP